MMIALGAVERPQGNGDVSRVRRARAIGVVAAGLILLAALVALAGWRYELSRAGGHEVLFIIPRGTASLQANGKDDLMLPRQIMLYVGERDTLVIRNEDDFPVRIGPFKLEAGQHYRQRFRAPGKFSLVCTTMYHEEQMDILVSDGPNLVHRMLGDLFRP